MSTYDEFLRLASSGSYAQAVNWMDAHGSQAAFDGCFALAANTPAAFQALWDSVPYEGDKISDFALDFIYAGAMPQRYYASMGWDDYDNARFTFLKGFEHKFPKAWPDRQATAKTVCLYPEFGFSNTLRQTIIDLAVAHNGLGPGNPYQANLFCLGGRYTYSIGMAGAHPGKPGTTCMLFARSILHAAGVNVIGPNTPKSCSCDKGLKAEIQHLNCYVDTKGATSQPQPQPGDVFHIQGGAFTSGAGSDHVGIIVEIAGNKWTCIQGGAPDHVTKKVTYTVTPMPGSHAHGNWYFSEDITVTSADGSKSHRGIIGYWNIDQIGSSGRLSGGVPAFAGVW